MLPDVRSSSFHKVLHSKLSSCNILELFTQIEAIRYPGPGDPWLAMAELVSWDDKVRSSL